VEYEPDQRHAEIIVASMNLSNANGVTTPGSHSSEVYVGDEEHLRGHEATLFRALAARANYLGQDRPDIQFAAKEIARKMSSPTQGDWAKLKRLARYLKSNLRYVHQFRWQSTNKINVYTDSDYAGCRSMRKSTSGGLMLLGGHLVRSWSSTQAIIATSSGEAEYYGIVKAGSVGLGAQSMLSDLGREMEVVILTDSSAAKAIASRTGLGKVRHIDVHYLWIQEIVKKRGVQIKKVDGKLNPADLLTKHLSRECLDRCLMRENVSKRDGRSALLPAISDQLFVSNSAE